MKKIFVLISLMICISQFSFSQITWCPAGATWHYDYSGMANAGYVKTTYVSDVVFQGVNCKKLNEHIQWRWYNGGALSNFYRDIYTYENNNIVFGSNILQNGNSDWDTIFNFNAVPGDRWHWNSLDTSYIQVEDTGHKIIDSVNLKWMYVSYHTSGVIWSNPYDTIYERLGSLILYHFDARGLFGSDFEIWGLCNYSDSSFALYGNSDSACTILPNGIVELEEIENSMSVYPNPGSDFIKVSSASTIQSIKIHDVFGRLVFNSAERKKLFEINAELFANGIFFIQASTKNKTISVKWVKTD